MNGISNRKPMNEADKLTQEDSWRKVIYAASLSGVVALIIWLRGLHGAWSLESRVRGPKLGALMCRWMIMEARHAEMQMEGRRKLDMCVCVWKDNSTFFRMPGTRGTQHRRTFNTSLTFVASLTHWLAGRLSVNIPAKVSFAFRVRRQWKLMAAMLGKFSFRPSLHTLR